MASNGTAAGSATAPAVPVPRALGPLAAAVSAWASQGASAFAEMSSPAKKSQRTALGETQSKENMLMTEAAFTKPQLKFLDSAVIASISAAQSVFATAVDQSLAEQSDRIAAVEQVTAINSNLTHKHQEQLAAHENELIFLRRELEASRTEIAAAKAAAAAAPAPVTSAPPGLPGTDVAPSIPRDQRRDARLGSLGWDLSGPEVMARARDVLQRSGVDENIFEAMAPSSRGKSSSVDIMFKNARDLTISSMQIKLAQRCTLEKKKSFPH